MNEQIQKTTTNQSTGVIPDRGPMSGSPSINPDDFNRDLNKADIDQKFDNNRPPETVPEAPEETNPNWQEPDVQMQNQNSGSDSVVPGSQLL